MQDRRGEKGAGSLGEDGGPEQGGAIERLDDGGCCCPIEISVWDVNGMHSTFGFAHHIPFRIPMT